MTKNIYNKILKNIYKNIRKTAKNNDEDIIKICEMILKIDQTKKINNERMLITQTFL